MTKIKTKAAMPAEHSKDYTKYTFKGHVYGKGPLVLAVVRDYVDKHPNITVKKLEETFHIDSISMPILSKPKRDKKLRSRFFREAIHVGKQAVVVTNQWSKNNISSFIDFVKKELKQDVRVARKMATA